MCVYMYAVCICRCVLPMSEIGYVVSQESTITGKISLNKPKGKKKKSYKKFNNSSNDNKISVSTILLVKWCHYSDGRDMLLFLKVK